MAISTGQRARARRWSRLIHASYPDVQGLLYASSMHANQPSVAHYERSQSALPPSPVFHRALSDPALTDRVKRAAVVLGYKLV